jgi:site-specific DNA-methyltransferase (adenine-specific)
VTSPPYFAGKQYEADLGRDGVPGSYVEYLTLLRDVFAECRRVLEPGGRIAVNVANLGRRPYRSLSADVTRLLQDELGLLLRGEVLWRKAEGASGSCAFGSFRSPTNPVLRDLTERVIVAGKDRFDRAVSPAERRRRGWPHEATVSTDEFLAATLDVWDLPAESARRVGHPAPFPVALPERLIRLYTYRGDLVLDPFVGSGSTLVAALRTGRRGVGYDTERSYVELARQRVAEAEAAGPSVPAEAPTAVAAAEALLMASGWEVVARRRRVRGTGVVAGLVVRAGSHERVVLVAGSHVVGDVGLGRADTLWRCLGQAAALQGARSGPTLLLATALPPRGSESERALGAAASALELQVVSLDALDAPERLRPP